MSAKGEILRRVAASTDETLGKGNYWRRASFMREFGFTDAMDILLYYLSLQLDLRTFAAKIKVGDFFRQPVRRHWQKRARELFPFIQGFPWASGPGPMDGTAGLAESYRLGVGLFDKSLLTWFLWPESLKEESEKNWPKHKEKIENMLFPKLRRKYNQKKLVAALTFAEEVCEVMRQEAKEKSEKLNKR